MKHAHQVSKELEQWGGNAITLEIGHLDQGLFEILERKEKKNNNKNKNTNKNNRFPPTRGTLIRILTKTISSLLPEEPL